MEGFEGEAPKAAVLSRGLALQCGRLDLSCVSKRWGQCQQIFILETKLGSTSGTLL